MITVNDLPQIIGFLGYGIVIGVAFGVCSFIFASLINTFFGIADE